MREDLINCKLVDIKSYGYAFKSSNYSNTGIPVLRIGGINEWKVDSSGAKRIQENVSVFQNIIEYKEKQETFTS